MEIRAELCHVDTLRCVVRVEAWRDGEQLGSALGEAAHAEEAEERALERLRQRLGPTTPAQTTASENTRAAVPPEKPAPPRKVQTEPMATPEQTPEPTPEPPSETPTDPDDWSEELTAIDLEIQRIGWERDQEQIYLNRAFGLGSRHKLTRYADLVAYLRQLRLVQAHASPEQAGVPIRRGDLISQGDQMLKQLGWGGEQARNFLKQHLGSTSRQQLSDEQLLQFNMLLEEVAMKGM